MSPDVAVVPLRWWHLAALMPLERGLFAPDDWSEELFWSELALGPARSYVVALDHDELVGYAGVAVAPPDSAVQTVAVAPGRQGGGVGTRLMLDLLRAARAGGATVCTLEVRTDNPRAQTLYRRLGFAPLGVRRAYYQPSGGDALVMRAQRIDSAEYGRMLDGVAAAARGAA